jgi:hypothetical protein
MCGNNQNNVFRNKIVVLCEIEILADLRELFSFDKLAMRNLQSYTSTMLLYIVHVSINVSVMLLGPGSPMQFFALNLHPRSLA